MKKTPFLFLCAGLAAWCCEAAPQSSSKALPKLAPPPIVSQWKEERVQVRETGEFTSISLPEKAKSKKSTSQSEADRFSENNKKFQWKPSPLLSSTIRTADLTGAALSGDGSLAVVAERVGGEGKANSTRFVFFDIRNRRLSGGFTVKETLLSSIAFAPETPGVITAVRSSFAPFNVKNGIVKVDLKTKSIVDSLDSPGNKAVTSFDFGKKGKLFFTTADSPVIYEVEHDSFAVEPVAVKSRLSAPQVCVAGDLLLAYGKEGIETFRRDEGRWIPDENILPFSAPFVPVKSTVIDAKAPAVCFSGAFEEDLWYYRDGKVQKLKERAAGIQFWDVKRQFFFVEAASNSQVFLFQMPEAVQLGKPASPNRLKPANRNGSFALLGNPALKDRMIQIDSRGNVFILDYSRPARWKKYIVYIADRAGFR